MIAFLNFLTISRILAALVLFILLFIQNESYLILILFFYAGISDFFDGYLARKYNATSLLGEVMDPVADKIMIVFVLIGISIYLSSAFVGFLTAIIISREIWVASLRDINARSGNTSATKVLFIAKAKTTIQIVNVMIYLIAIVFNINLLVLIADIFLIFTSIITLYSGLIYSINTFKFNE